MSNYSNNKSKYSNNYFYINNSNNNVLYSASIQLPAQERFYE